MSANAQPESPNEVPAEEPADAKTAVKHAFAAWLKRPTPLNRGCLTGAMDDYLADFKAQLVKDFS